MELLKEFKNQEIQVLCDNKNNISQISFFDLDTNIEYKLKDILKSDIGIKKISFDDNRIVPRAIIYSTNGNEFSIPLYSLNYDIRSVKVETTLKDLFDEFYLHSIQIIGQSYKLDTENKTLKIEKTDKDFFFKKNKNGTYTYKAGSREEEKSSDNYEEAVIGFLNNSEQVIRHCISMSEMHGDRPPRPLTRKNKYELKMKGEK